MQSLEVTEQDQFFALRQELQTWKARAQEAERRTALSPDTLELAHRALLHMKTGVIPWAAINDEIDARRMLGRLDRACAELKVARGLK